MRCQHDRPHENCRDRLEYHTTSSGADLERADLVAARTLWRRRPLTGVNVAERTKMLIDAPTNESPTQASPRLSARIGAAVGSAWEWCFGMVSLLIGLAVLASIPVLSFLSLGYLLEVSGRVARTGSFRQGFVGVRKAARIGGVALGTWLLMIPLRFLSDLWYSSQIIEAGSGATRALRVVLVMAVVVVVAHGAWACFRGGKLRYFFWPAPLLLLQRLPQGNLYREASDRLWNFTTSLRLPYYFSLGFRGFAGAVAWLFVPISVIIASITIGGGAGILLGLIGAVLLGGVLFHLSFLEVHFACENRLVAMFDLGYVRQAFRRAPIAFWFSLLLTLASAIPLYLLKIELTPRQATWLPSLFFVAFIAPARLISGWAMARARRRQTPRNFLFRWGARLGELPVIGFYVLIVFLMPFLTWNGKWGMFEQHAFLLPVPFFK